jgi:hypothetical protein
MTRRGIERAREAGWECTVEKMQSLIGEAVDAKTPPGAFLS